jgi:hypothetical protein
VLKASYHRTRMDEVCTANISAIERYKRLRGGLIALVLGLIVLVVFVAFGVNSWWRLTLFPLFAGAALGYFQWRDET